MVLRAEGCGVTLRQLGYHPRYATRVSRRMVHSGAEKMQGMFFRVRAKEGRKAELLAFLKWDAEVARQTEPGTLRFDVYEDPADPNAVFLYEAYESAEAFERHKANEPFKKWQAEIVPDLVEGTDRLLPISVATASNAESGMGSQ